jgi:hypothetical protein
MKIFNLILPIISLIIASKALDCDTPVECFVKAIDVLHQAREEYHSTTDKLRALIEKVKPIVDNAVELRKKIEIQNNINTNFNNTFNKLEGGLNSPICYNHYTSCTDESQGLFYLLKSELTMCGEYFVYIRDWSLITCTNPKQLRIRSTCCQNYSK